MITHRTLTIAEAIELAIEHQQSGRLREAELIYCEVLRGDPNQVDAAYRLADIYSELGDLDNARNWYEMAIAIKPDFADAHNSLGVTHQMQHRVADATRCFARAQQLAPKWAVPHFNLGLSLREQSAMPAAAREFREAWIRDPGMSSAARQCVETMADWARAEPLHRIGPLPDSGLAPQFISVVFCSIDDAKDAALQAMYRRLLDGSPHEVIPIRDARSLAEAYNRGVAASRGDVVLLSHDDIDILAPDFGDRLRAHLRCYDTVGVMGATRMIGPAWSWSHHPHLRGWITNRAPGEREWRVGVVDPRPVADDIAVLDGVLIAARREVFKQVDFDEETFDGFHIYDIDWSFRAAQAGFRLAVAGDLQVVHASKGRFDSDWAEYADRFCFKYGLDDLPPPPPLQLIEAVFGNSDEVRAFFGRLAGEGNSDGDSARISHAPGESRPPR